MSRRILSIRYNHSFSSLQTKPIEKKPIIWPIVSMIGIGLGLGFYLIILRSGSTCTSQMYWEDMKMWREASEEMKTSSKRI